MEVHHHAHSGGRKWTHYLWEFLMLFLAVTLGFFVENQREHYIEHVRAKEFAATLVRDLENDTASIHAEVKTTKVYISNVDSVLMLSKTRLEGLAASRFSFYTRFLYWTVPISWNRATFEQVKNSGSLRYFRNYKLQDKLTRYEALINEIKSEANSHTERGTQLLNIINEIIDPAYHKELSKHFLYSVDTMTEQTKQYLYTFNSRPSLENKRAEIDRLLNMAIVQQRNLQRDVNVPWLQAEKLAVELIGDLKKEYHIK